MLCETFPHVCNLYLMWTDSLIQVVPSDPASVPVPRQALSMTTWGHKVIISGGLDADLQPLNSVHMFDVNTSEWETLAVKGNLLKRYKAYIIQVSFN